MQCTICMHMTCRFGIADQLTAAHITSQSLTAKELLRADPDRADPVAQVVEVAAGAQAVGLVADKLHVHSLDKRICKQMRDTDVKVHQRLFNSFFSTIRCVIFKVFELYTYSVCLDTRIKLHRYAR
jgi:hypothetical protein